MKNIILIGMPGTGKSVVGRALARRLGYTFLDVDDRIVEQAGMTLPEILRTQGLEAFLEIEGPGGTGTGMREHRDCHGREHGAVPAGHGAFAGKRCDSLAGNAAFPRSATGCRRI